MVKHITNLNHGFLIGGCRVVIQLNILIVVLSYRVNRAGEKETLRRCIAVDADVSQKISISRLAISTHGIACAV